MHNEVLESLDQSDLKVAIDLIRDKAFAGKKIAVCGNGGSAADALHLAAEFSGRFYLNRKALPVEALNVNEAALTAISNDFGFDKIYERSLESLANSRDILIAITTSGNSKNISATASKFFLASTVSSALSNPKLTPLLSSNIM